MHYGQPVQQDFTYELRLTMESWIKRFAIEVIPNFVKISVNTDYVLKIMMKLIFKTKDNVLRDGISMTHEIMTSFK